MRRKAFWDLNKVVAAEAVVLLGEWWSAGSWLLLLLKIVGSITLSQLGEENKRKKGGEIMGSEVLLEFLKAATIKLE